MIPVDMFSVSYLATPDAKEVTVQLFDRKLDAFRCYRRVTADGTFALIQNHESGRGPVQRSDLGAQLGDLRSSHLTQVRTV